MCAQRKEAEKRRVGEEHDAGARRGVYDDHHNTDAITDATRNAKPDLERERERIERRYLQGQAAIRVGGGIMNGFRGRLREPEDD